MNVSSVRVCWTVDVDLKQLLVQRLNLIEHNLDLHAQQVVSITGKVHYVHLPLQLVHLAVQ